MAYALKTEGIATQLLACFGIDEDGTAKDFVPGNTATHNGAIPAPRTGVDTWKGTNRGWFRTDANPDQYQPRGVTWPAADVVVPAAGFALFVAVRSITTVASQIMWGEAGSNNNNFRTNASGQPLMRVSATDQPASTQALAAGTKLSIGMNFKNNSSGLGHFYGLESGSLALVNNFVAGDWMGDFDLREFGGIFGEGSMPGDYYIKCLFSAPSGLSLANFQALHNDWFNTLFQAPAASTVNGAITLLLTPNGSIVASGSRTVTATLVSRAGGAQAGLTNIDWYWSDTWGGPVIASGSAESTDGSGVIVVNIPGTALTPGQSGYLAVKHASGLIRIYYLQVA